MLNSAPWPRWYGNLVSGEGLQRLRVSMYTLYKQLKVTRLLATHNWDDRLPTISLSMFPMLWSCQCSSCMVPKYCVRMDTERRKSGLACILYVQYKIMGSRIKFKIWPLRCVICSGVSYGNHGVFSPLRCRSLAWVNYTASDVDVFTAISLKIKQRFDAAAFDRKFKNASRFRGTFWERADGNKMHF